MNEKGIPRPPPVNNWLKLNQGSWGITDEVWKWITRVWNNYPKVQTFEQTLTPSSVNANSESVQTFTVTGLTTMDVVSVNKPTNQSGLDLVHCWVSSANTLSIKYRNHTGGGITPTSQAYRIVAIRI